MKGIVKIKISEMLINIVFPLVMGLIIYMFYRPDTYVSRAISGFVFGLGPEGKLAGNWFITGYACDMLWGYSLAYTLSSIINEKFVFVGIICFIFESLIETLQSIGIIDGTFDFFDIATEFISSILAIYLFRKRRKVYEKND